MRLNRTAITIAIIFGFTTSAVAQTTTAPQFNRNGIKSAFCPTSSCPPAITNLSQLNQYVPYSDPVFGTKITRVTGSASTSGQCIVPDSVWSVFNADSSVLYAQCTTGIADQLFDLNKMTDAISAHNSRHDDGTVDNSISSGQPVVVGVASAVWSSIDPKILYFVGRPNTNTKSYFLYRVDVSLGGSARFGNNATNCQTTNTLGCIKQFWPNDTSGYDLSELSMSENEDVFSFHSPPDQSSTQVWAYVKSTDTLTQFPTQGSIHRESISKAARVDTGNTQTFVYVTDESNNQSCSNDAGCPTNWACVSGKCIAPNYWWSGPSFSSTNPGTLTLLDYGHYDLGRSFYLAANNGEQDYWNNGTITHTSTSPGIDLIDYNSFSSASSIFQSVDASNNSVWWAFDISMRNYDEKLALISSYEGGTTPDSDYNKPFTNELILAFTDNSSTYSSQSFMRFANIRTANTASTNYQPHGSIDKLGRYVAFTQDPNGSGYYDVFVARLPRATHPLAGPVTSSSSTVFHLDTGGNAYAYTSSTWNSIINNITGGIAADTGGNGYAVNIAGHLVMFYSYFGTYFSSDDGQAACGPLGGTPSFTLAGTGQTVFVRCLNGSLAAYNNSSWVNLGAPTGTTVTSDPAAFYQASNSRPEAWVSTANGHVYNACIGCTPVWTDMGAPSSGKFGGSPGAVKGGLVETLIVADDSGNVYVPNNNGVLTSMGQVNCAVDGDISTVVMPSSNDTWAFARCKDGLGISILHYVHSTGTWTDETKFTYTDSTLGVQCPASYTCTTPLSQPTAGTDGTNPIFYVQTSSGRQLSVKLTSGTWTVTDLGYERP